MGGQTVAAIILSGSKSSILCRFFCGGCMRLGHLSRECSASCARLVHIRPLRAASVFALVAVVLEISLAIAQTPSDKKPQDNSSPPNTAQPSDKKDTTDKKDASDKKDSKTPSGSGSQAADNASPINCVIYMQYEGALGEGSKTIASNADLEGSAKALAGELGDSTFTAKVDKDVTLEGAFEGFIDKKDGKRTRCCKRIDIVSHGDANGKVDLPYKTGKQNDSNKLGGRPASYGLDLNPKKRNSDQVRLANFVESLKGAACPEKEKPPVHFQGCWSASGGSSIAAEVNDIAGFETSGYTGQCDFPKGKNDKGEDYWESPRPLNISEEKTFPALKDEGSMLIIPGVPDTNREQYAGLIPGGFTPGYFASYSRPSFATDSTAYCTFGEGIGVPGYVTSSDSSGNSIPAAYVDGSSTQDTTPDTKIARSDSASPRDDVSDRSTGDKVTPKPAEQPTSSPPTEVAKTPEPAKGPPSDPLSPEKKEDPPPAATTDTPATTTDTQQVTIFIKASEAVLDGGQTGEPIQGQIVKLVMREKPGLPSITQAKNDTGFEKPAPQCTTGAGGECKVTVPAEDRALYALNDAPRAGGKPASYYRLAVNVMKHTGGVAETTGKQVSSEISAKGVTAEIFKVGGRTFMRLGFNTPTDLTDDQIEKYRALLGVPVEVDICLVKEPGPPLGAEPVSYSAINQELPHAAIRFQPTSRRMRR
jgi:hypothetical protein